MSDVALSALLQAIIVLVGCIVAPLIFSLISHNDTFIREEIKDRERHLRRFAIEYSPAIGYYFKLAVRNIWLFRNKDQNSHYSDGMIRSKVVEMKDAYLEKYLKCTPYEVILKYIEMEFNSQMVKEKACELRKLTDNFVSSDLLNDDVAIKLPQVYDKIIVKYDELFELMASEIKKMKHELKYERLKLDIDRITRYFNVCKLFKGCKEKTPKGEL